MTCILILASCLGLVANSSGEILIGNAEFEDYPVAVGGYIYNLAPWQWANASGSWPAWVSNGYYAFEPEPVNPILFAEGCTIYQPLSEEYANGGTYEYSLDVAVRYESDSWEFWLYDATAGDYSTPLVSRGSADPGEVPIDLLTWTRKSLTFEAPAAIAGNQIGVAFTGGPWTMFDNVALVVPAEAYGPDPYDGEINVLVDKTLRWNTGRHPDPNLPSLPNPDITQHIVYMSLGDPDDPNLFQVASIPATGNTAEYTPDVELERGTTYCWRVDERLDSDENVITGDVWMFETVGKSPVIDGEPADALADAGADVVFVVDAFNPVTGLSDDLSYEWYKVGSPDQLLQDGAEYSGTQTAALTIIDVQIEDEGQYYCLLTNTSGNTESETSWPAALAIKKMVAWWKFDETTGSTAADSSPDGPGTPATVITQNTPDSVWNPNGISGGALDCNGSNTWADTGALAADLGIDGNKPRSVSAWVYTRSFNNGGIFDVGTRQTAKDFSLRTLGNDNQWRIQYWDGDRDFTYPSKNAWVHFVLTHGPDGTKVYADGILIEDWPGKVLDTGDQFTFRIGHYGPDNQKFNGLIDDLRLYNYVLDPVEVAELYIGIKPDETLCLSRPRMDVTGPDGVPDCVVDYYDLAKMASEWMLCNTLPDCL